MFKSFVQSAGRLSLTKTRTLLHAALLVGALVVLPATPGQAAVPSDPFVILLKGIYQPVVHAPNLGLKLVDLNDGTFWTVGINPVSGLPGNRKEDKPIGSFYARFDNSLPPLCAYKVPGGAFTAVFLDTSAGFVDFVDDGHGGTYLIGTWELTILEGTGIYKSFVGGHIHMDDILDALPNGTFDEQCVCHISRP